MVVAASTIAACSVYDLGSAGGTGSSTLASTTGGADTVVTGVSTSGTGGEGGARTTGSTTTGAGGGATTTAASTTGATTSSATTSAATSGTSTSTAGTGGTLGSGGATGSTGGGSSGTTGTSGGAGVASGGAGGSNGTGGTQGGSAGRGGSGGGTTYGGTPYKGVAAPIGMSPSVQYAIEGENYDAGGEGISYHDTTPTNTLGAYRSGAGEAVDVESACGNSCFDVGAIEPGEWTKYTVAVAVSASYGLQLGAASATPKKMHIEVDGTDVTGALTVDTGGATVFRNINVTVTVPLTAGTHVMTFVFDEGGMALNWVKLQR